MIRAACHCTAIRLEIEAAPSWVNDCNCTLCRRYGALWAYYEPGEVKLVQGEGTTDTYRWDSKMLAFHRCNACGCVTHFEALTDTPFICGVNARMMPALDPANVTWNTPAFAPPYLLVRNAREAACYRLPLVDDTVGQ